LQPLVHGPWNLLLFFTNLHLRLQTPLKFAVGNLRNDMTSHGLLNTQKPHNTNVKHTASVWNCTHKFPTVQELKGLSVTSYHTATGWMVMCWVPVHDRVKYCSLLHSKRVLWVYTASYKGVGGADSLRWMLESHVHLVLRIRPLFHACFVLLQMPLLLTTAYWTSGAAIFCHCFSH
jgi:hypothetical protein